MKMALAERPIERIATSKTESQFTIKATGKAFKILSSGLYKEKVLAIVRELSCNAYDAHIAAGTPHRPFDVHLPNAMEPFFSVRDYGPSLSPERIGPVYTTYFESTKTESNELIGGLGLGSKSPFCYVDSFTVISRYKGMRRTYTCFFDETDTPSLLLMSEEESDEETGLEVKLPVRAYNFGEFRNKAEQVYKFFETEPNVVGSADYKLNKTDVLLYGRGYKLRDEHGRRSNAMMGVVAYPIDTSAVQGLTHEQDRFLNSSALDIEFGIGDLDITAGREELGYDLRTQQAIVARTAEVMQDITDRVIKKMSECKNEFEARKLHGELSRFGYVLHGFPDNKVPFKGKLIDSDRFALNLGEDYQGLTILKFTERTSYGRNAAKYDGYSGQNWRKGEKFFIPASPRLAIIVDDIKGRFISGRIREYREENPNDVVMVLRREEIKPKPVVETKADAIKEAMGLDFSNLLQVSQSMTAPRPPAEEAPAEPVEDPMTTDYIAKLAKLLDGVEFKNLSDLPRPEPVPRAQTGISVMTDHYKSGLYTHFGREAWRVGSSPDVNGEGVYVGTISGCIQSADKVREENFASFYKTIVDMGLWDKSHVIYSIPKTLVGPYADAPGWVNLYDLIKQKLSAIVAQPEWPVKAGQQRSFDKFMRDHAAMSDEFSFINAVARRLSKPDHAWCKFARMWDSNRTGDTFQAQLKLADRLEIKLPKAKEVNISGEWSKLKNEYPLITYVLETYKYGRNEEKMAREFTDYINGIDGTNCKG